MNLKLAIAASLVVSVLVPSRDELVLSPSKERVLVKTFEVSNEIESDTTYENGGSVENFATRLKWVFRDDVLDRDDERVTRLRRTYVEISGGGSGTVQRADGDREWSSTISSEVEGVTVVFTWDENDGAYVSTSEDIGGDVLNDLEYDVDFGALLPGDDASEGDEWSVDAESFVGFASRVQSMPMVADYGDGVATTLGDGPEPEEETYDGEIRVTFDGTRVEDGVRVAVLSLEGELRLERTSHETSDGEAGSMTSHIDFVEESEVRGEVLWNIDARHLFSLRIEQDRETNTSIASARESGGEVSKSERVEKSKWIYTTTFAPEDE